MRLQRMTTRRWMVVVAVVGLFCTLEHRRRVFGALAKFHESRACCLEAWVCGPLNGPSDSVFKDELGRVRLDADWRVMTRDEVRAAGWHASLADKYRYASRYPWLPVEPDPTTWEKLRRIPASQ
jgi:hypothetical protein